MKFVYLFMAVAIAVISYQDVSADDSWNECDIACPFIFLPVCAEDAKGNRQTFSNECLLRSYNCREKTAFIMKDDGECDQ